MNTENNILIAEFLGSVLKDASYLDKKGNFHELFIWTEPFVKLPIEPITNKILSYGYSVGDFKFNSDWNWLMIAVEQIETNPYNVPEKLRTGFMKNTIKSTKIIRSSYDDRKEFLGWNSSAWIGTKTIYDSTMLFEDTHSFSSKIEAVYNAVIAFINWHNENKNK